MQTTTQKHENKEMQNFPSGLQKKNAVMMYECTNVWIIFTSRDIDAARNKCIKVSNFNV